MSKLSVLTGIKQLRRMVFTTREIACCCRKSLSATTQALSYLVHQKVVLKITRGVWGLEITDAKLSPYQAIPFLLPHHRAYVSFISALHLYGIIEQIPQVITLASTAHTRTIHTKLGTFSIHRIAPSFFRGFDWYKGNSSFLIAEPEKAFVDCLYLSARKKKQFGYFPELHFPSSFSFKKVNEWILAIPDARIRIAALKKSKIYLKRNYSYPPNA